MTVTKEKYVTIAYSFETPDGQLLGTSDRQGPLTFCAGSGDIISGLDSRLAGAEEGQAVDFIIPAAEAYGERDEALTAQVAVADLGLHTEPKIGYRVEAEIGGRLRPAFISDLENGIATLDANHPLAGVPLHFKTVVLSIGDEAPVMESCGCGGGGCGSGGGGCGGGCGSESAEASTEACGCGGSCDCGGH